MNADAIRSSDAERERAQTILREALGRGQISIGEFDERLQRCLTAQTRGDLLEPLADLMVNPHEALFGRSGSGPSLQDARFAQNQAPPRAAGVLSPRPQAQPDRNDSASELAVSRGGGDAAVNSPEEVAYRTKRLVTGEKASTRPALAAFSRVRMRNWVVPQYYEVRTLFGEATLDLSSARLAAHETTLDIFALFGDVTVKVPEGIRVVIEVAGVLGETRLRIARGAVRPEDLPVDAPVVRVTGTAVFGDVRVVINRAG